MTHATDAVDEPVTPATDREFRRSWTIGRQLAVGFGIAVATTAVAIVVMTKATESTRNKQAALTEERLPAQEAVESLIADLLTSSIDLQQYLLLRDDAHDESRRIARQRIQKSMTRLERLAADWSQADRTHLEGVIAEIEHLGELQQSVAAMSTSADNRPADVLFDDQGRPLLATLESAIDRIVEVERTLSGTDLRKRILGLAAEVRAHVARFEPRLAAYLSGGRSQDLEAFDRDWASAGTVIAELSKARDAMTQEQVAALERFQSAWSEFEPLKQQLFEIRAGHAWDRACELLATDVQPARDAAVGKLDELGRFERERSHRAAAAVSETISASAFWVVVCLVIGSALAALSGWWVTRRIRRSANAVVDVARKVAAGNLTCHATVSSRDELGEISVSMNTAIDHFRTLISEIGTHAEDVESNSQELSNVSTGMRGAANDTANRAQFVSSATDEVNSSVQAVASATEELQASIAEIASNVSSATGVATNAVARARETNATVEKLGTSSAEIGDVIKVINSIAEQTNLLALNATIEAARAGDAGKGFAVVASEVKELAKATAGATQQIADKIETIQRETEGAVREIAGISEVIDQINEIQTSIAAAIEEQSATTAEIGRSVQSAATSTAEITQTIRDVATAAQETSTGAANTETTSSGLSEMSTALRELVHRFQQ